MKNSVTTTLLLLFITTAYSQNFIFNYQGRNNPSIKKETLNGAEKISEIMPDFCNNFFISYNETQVSQQLKLNYYSNGYYINPQDNYNLLIDYANVEITTICHGKTLSFQSKSDLLTTEQKNILYAADLGTDIRVKITFKNKNQYSVNFDKGSNIKEGEYVVTVIPETEAEFPGGFPKLSEYIRENVTNKISGKSAINNIQEVIVNFTINEDGQTEYVKLTKSSSDPKLDKLVHDAFNKMPKWTPAKNLLGKKVKQNFSIPLGGGGC